MLDELAVRPPHDGDEGHLRIEPARILTEPDSVQLLGSQLTNAVGPAIDQRPEPLQCLLRRGCELDRVPQPLPGPEAPFPAQREPCVQVAQPPGDGGHWGRLRLRQSEIEYPVT